MIFQALAPSTEVFAQELDAVMEASVSAARAAGNTARSVQDAVATALQDADQATSDDVATTPGADAGATEGGDGSTNAGESQDSTTDGTTNGDTPTEGDASQDDAAADEGAADGEQADDADADAADQANTAPTIATVEDLRHALGDGNVITDDLGAVTAITFESNADLIAISNTDPAIYQNANISKGGSTGIDFDVCGAEIVDGLGSLTFQGFGSDAYPFKGALNLGDRTLTVNKTLFNNIELSDANSTVKLTWKGTDAQPIVAAKVTGADKTLAATVTVGTPKSDTEKDICKLASPLVGEVTGALTLNATYVTSANSPLAIDMQSSTGNMGLLVNTLAEGASLTLAGLALTDKLDGTPTINATAADANAGGLIGEAREGATVALPTGIDVSALSVAGKNAAGGLIGKATNLTLNIADGVTVKPACNVGDKDSACSGGVIGDVSFAQGFIVKPNMFDLGKLVTLGASQRAGALFGVADISNGDIVVQGGTYKSKFTLPEEVSFNGSYGGLVGKVFTTAKGVDESLRAFVVQKDANKKTCSIEFELAGKLSDTGGVVGYVGDSADSNSQPVAVVLDGVTVACKGDASARTDAGKFGGAVGVVDARNVLDVRDFKLTSDNPIGKAQSNRAAGIAGSAWNAVIKFSGITDLSGASFAENSTTGQLVYENHNALIFAAGDGSDADKGAAGWTFKRSNTASKTDDIATYGEVIRLGGDFIKLDVDTHKLTLPDSLTAANGAYTLTSVEDFAKLAITWQTNGYYSMVEGVSENNPNILQSSTITVNGTIDLKGTGLTAFTQDRADGSQVFLGTLNGGGTNGNGTINLAVGEPYGKRGEAVLDGNDTSNGNGKIYRHGRLGLFAAVNGATISNVTIAGSMKFDNGSAIDAGSLAGTIVGNLPLSGVTCKTNIACDDTFGNEVNIGGIAGSVSAASTVAFKDNSRAQATIAATKTLNGNSRIGGAIGYVGDYGSSFNVAGLEVAGSIETGNCTSGKIAQVGGLIGCIAQSTYGADGAIANSAKKDVNITGLSFNSFKMGVGKNGDKLNGVGGLLGYSWGNAVVTIGDDNINKSENSYALKTTNASIIATVDDSKELGGLVYAASGHWIINNYAIDLSGTKINAGAAQTLGVLVCRGCKVDDKTTYGVESYLGLYLEDRAYWDTAYRVPTGEGAIVASGVTSFDEWVGSGVKPNNGSKLMDADWNTVVSLHTQKNKLDMDGDSTKDNSYHNRSSFGRSQNTNGNTRYFYNLDIASKNCEGGFSGSQIDTADKLLLWSAFCYAPAGIRSTIVPDGTTGLDDSITITGTIDLAGYSYYPTQPIGEVTVNNAAITFYYSKIKAEQNGNKLNSDATQHENMHCGLFQTVADGDLTVSNVTLGGTVGPVINDGKSSTDAIGAGGSSSGALVCRYVYGSSDGNGTKIRKISIDDLTLNNLIVDGANSATDANAYMPLLINEMQKYVSLNAKNIKTTGYTSGTKAATSLFGKLGVGSEADQVTAKFEQISLPSQENNTIFTHASLLESFGYGSTSTGSADYTFTKADADAGKVTYGIEIDAKDKEYSGKQLWYYDKETYATPNGLVTVDKKPADAKNPRFGDYLPYVYKGKATEDGVQYHEIKVNQRIPNLMTGCGTYGDPYAVTDATEMNAIANYINNSVALDGWEVTIAADQSRLCERRSKTKIDGARTDNEVVYVYKQANGAGNKWEKKNGDATTDPSQTLSDETMHRYVQSAYYSIEPPEGNKITVDAASFGGFGNKANPFRGVIVGDLGKSTAAIEIENNKGELRGLIPYSYGSVVRNLNINYVNAQATITYSDKDEDGVPTAFFGGVIGCILGGDNIIDGVVVNNPNNGSTAYGFTVVSNPDVSRSHLVPIGGYVGAIAGGGVIFRHTGDSWRGGTKEKFKPVAKGGANSQLYDNPYVGRVIDGYAFSEGCAVKNGDANYKINELKDKGTPCVTTTGTDNKYIGTNAEAPVTTVENAQGLLVLSAIISSGAGAGAAQTDYADYGVFRGSKAYWGNDTEDPAICGYLFGNKNYGKVRNANYDSVGKPAGVASDFEAAKNDDQKAPGKQGWHGPLDADNDVNSPYLVASYAANYQTGYVCASKSIGMSLEFKQGAPYDMTGYGTGYVGLNGRYYSNACDSNEATTDRDRITPHIATIDGNGATITVGTEDAAYGAVEYADDDYKVSGVGGLFSTVMFTSTNVGQSVTANDRAQVKDLTFSNCNVALTYIDTNGEAKPGQATNDLIGTGLLAGATANYDVWTCGVYRNVQMKNCTVSGAKSVGGLLGSSGRASRSTDSDVTYMVKFSSTWAPMYLYDCSYTGLNVAGEKYVGGYVGTVASSSGVWTTAAKGMSEKAVGESSTITATGTTPYVGGVIGFAKSSHISVNTNIGATTAVPSSTAVISGVNVLATGENTDRYMGAGGVVGRVDGGVISMSNVRIDAGTGTKNAVIGDGTGKNFKIRNAGGLIGEVTSSGSPNTYWFEDCNVKNVNIAGTDQCSGGLIGYYFSNVNITCNNIAIENAAINGSWSGGLLGAINSGSDVIDVTNTKVSNTTFSGISNGGIAGDGRGQFHLVNVLMDGNTYKSGVKQGVLLGEVDTRDNQYGLFAAGVDVKPGNSKTTSDLPPMVYTTNTAAVNKKTYIAFGDYNDRLDVPGKDTTLYGADDTATTAASPYVTTSPVSTLAVRASNDDTTDRYLFGDGVAIDTATTIQGEAGTSVAGRYTYTNIGGINDAGAYQNTSTYSADSPRPTFNTNNVTSGKKVANDFPVLMIPGNDTTTVEKYLNIVTNGGFSDARRLNGSTAHVTATAEVFSLADNGTFVKDVAASQAPTLKVLNNGTSSMAFRASTDWDNEQGRFTLLTVTFSEAGQSYRVQVPIIVKRMLEIDFTATYSEGANFKAADYATKYDKHVLVSSGDTMTGYLTWTYGSARGKPVDYGWNTLLEAGGSMGPLNKSITFGATLPEGTQLTLVDTANNSREYHYTVGTGGATSVKLTEFVDAGNKAYYTEPWLSEIVGVKADEAKEDKDGAWVKLADDEVKDKSQAELAKMAGAKVDGAYYRARTSSDATGTFYTLSVDKEEPKSENFYLVVRTPAGSAGVNGYTATTVDTSLNEHINYLLRGKKAADGKAAEDGHQNTPSTYSVASNYTHDLIDNNEGGIKQMVLHDVTYPLTMKVSDTVKFDSNQQYTSSDALYYQLDSSLVNYGKNGSAAGAHGYPTGTQGTYSFYVKVGNNYYTWTGSKWTDAGTTETPAIAAKDWSATGGDMSLVLADTSGKAIDLSGIREIAKSHDNKFTITMKANLAMTEPACQAGIIASQNGGTDKYTKPNYRAYLSTNDETLSTSSNSAYIDGKAGYYRMDVGSSTIALEASKKSQLGINIDDLKTADGEIALVGTYDFSKLAGAEAMISSADTVTYTLSLQQRQDDGSYAQVGGIKNYITVLGNDKLGTVSLSADGKNYVFTDSKGTGGAFATRDGNSLAFKHAFRVKVNTDVETAGQTYANYRLVLTANMSDNGVIKDTPVNVSNLGGYKNSDYVTYTLARINTQGIPHGSN